MPHTLPEVLAVIDHRITALTTRPDPIAKARAEILSTLRRDLDR